MPKKALINVPFRGQWIGKSFFFSFKGEKVYGIMAVVDALENLHEEDKKVEVRKTGLSGLSLKSPIKKIDVIIFSILKIKTWMVGQNVVLIKQRSVMKKRESVRSAENFKKLAKNKEKDK